jgi:hypothetical protein
MRETLLAAQGLTHRYATTGALLLVAALVSGHAYGERKYSEWGPAVNLGCGVNSASEDLGPGISKDGRSLYFASNRQAPGAQGDRDIYVAQRPSREAPWGPPRNLGAPVNSTVVDNVISFSRDGHWMFFNSNRPGSVPDAVGTPSVDIWASYRHHVHDDFGWETPFNLGTGVNTAGFDGGASYFENKKGSTPLLFFGRGPTQATSDIWVAELLPDGTFGNAVPVVELNTPQNEQRPTIRFDGLEIFFFSTRPGSLGNDIWVATRASVEDPWNTPLRLTNVGEPVNTAFSEINPHISADGLTLYFASNRTVDAQGNAIGCGDLDLYMTTRTKLKRDGQRSEHDEDDDD